MKESRENEEKYNHSKGNNQLPESDFYCQLCAVDCVNNTGKLLHSLDANHIEAYLLSLKLAPKRKPSFQAESGLKSEWNKVTCPSSANECGPGEQHSVHNCQASDTQVSQEGKKYATSNLINERDSSKNIELSDPKLSLLNSQSSALRFGSTANETESGDRNITFEEIKERFLLFNFTTHTHGYHPKDGKNLKENVLSDKLNNFSYCTSKNSEVIEPCKIVSPDFKVHNKVSDVDVIDDVFKPFQASQEIQDDMISAANNINRSVISKFVWKPLHKDHSRKIILEGIPAGTDRDAIIRQFSKYGFIISHICIGATLHIEYFEWQSVEKIFAEQAQEKITIDGKEIQIKKNWGKSKKGFKLENLPKRVKTLFSSEENLLSQLDEFLASFQLNKLDICKQQAACDSVVSSLKFFAPRVYPYGSRITGLASKNSDLDMFVYITKPYKYFKSKDLRCTQELIIHDAAQDIMSSSDFSNVVKIPKASVPLISCKHVVTGLKCDLTFRYPYQVYNTGLIFTYLSLDQYVRPMMLLIRYWASAHGLVGKGKFSSYSLNLMCIFYLQQILNNPILPSVSLLMKLARDHEKASYGCWDCGYCEDISIIPKSVNDSSLFHHVKGFFKFFAEFDTNSMVVCPFLGRPVDKNIFHPGMEQLLPIEFEKYKSNCLKGLIEPFKVDHALCIQDPFIHNSNVARQNRKDIVERFQIYCRLYTHGLDYEDKHKCFPCSS